MLELFEPFAPHLPLVSTAASPRMLGMEQVLCLVLGSRFTLYRPSSVPFCHADTNVLYVYNKSNGNQEQLFLYSTLHSLYMYVCKHGNMYLNWGPRSARSSRTVYSKI